ncbi:MAG: MoaD/ThiS family protein [Thiolinea sp.]
MSAEMQVRLRMLGDLRRYLPVAGGFNDCELGLPAGATVQQLLERVAVPADKAVLVTHNGTMLAEADYRATVLHAQDEVVLFPPVKGG